MSDSIVSSLPAKTTPISGDILYLVDSQNVTQNAAGSSANLTLGNLYSNYISGAIAAGTMTLTNKTFDTAGSGNVLKINGTQVSAVTGTGSVVLATSPTLTSPKVVTVINDTNGNPVIVPTATASAINGVGITNGATGTGPTITVAGASSDTNANLTLSGKGTGQTVINGPLNYAADTGVADALVVAISGISAYVAGLVVRVKAANANATTTPTLNVNSLGAKTIKKQDGTTALAANDIKSGQLLTLIYDGTNLQMQSPVGNSLTPPAFNDNGSTISGQMLIETGRPTPVAGNNTNTQDFAITFTTAFKAATTPRVVANPDMSIGSGSSNSYCGISALSNTGFTVRMQLTTGTFSSGSTYSFHWIAIGQA